MAVRSMHSTSCDHNFWDMCEMIISPGVFLFFKNFDFLGFRRGVRGQKMVQNDKKLCPLCSISQEPYIHHMIVIYGTHV